MRVCNLKEDYMANVKEVIRILKGHMGELKTELRSRMHEYTEALAFEQAEDIRRKLEAIDAFQGRSTVVNVRMDEVDVFGYTENEKEAVIAYLQVNEV